MRIYYQPSSDCSARNLRPQCSSYDASYFQFHEANSEAAQLADALDKSWKQVPYTDESILREIIEMLSVTGQITPFEMHQSKLLESIYL